MGEWQEIVGERNRMKERDRHIDDLCALFASKPGVVRIVC